MVITVRIFGMIRLQSKIASINVNASDINELLKEVSKEMKNVEVRALKDSVIYVNGKNITELNSFKTKLQENDEVQIFSPMAGG